MKFLKSISLFCFIIIVLLPAYVKCFIAVSSCIIDGNCGLVWGDLMKAYIIIKQ